MMHTPLSFVDSSLCVHRAEIEAASYALFDSV
jgi:hypothetical protein